MAQFTVELSDEELDTLARIIDGQEIRTREEAVKALIKAAAVSLPKK